MLPLPLLPLLQQHTVPAGAHTLRGERPGTKQQRTVSPLLGRQHLKSGVSHLILGLRRRCSLNAEIDISTPGKNQTSLVEDPLVRRLRKPHLPDVEKGYEKNCNYIRVWRMYVVSNKKRRCARSSTGRGSTSRLQLINCNRPALIVASCTLSVSLIGCVSNCERLSAV